MLMLSMSEKLKKTPTLEFSQRWSSLSPKVRLSLNKKMRQKRDMLKTWRLLRQSISKLFKKKRRKTPSRRNLMMKTRRKNSKQLKFKPNWPKKRLFSRQMPLKTQLLPNSHSRWPLKSFKLKLKSSFLRKKLKSNQSSQKEWWKEHYKQHSSSKKNKLLQLLWKQWLVLSFPLLKFHLFL